MQIIHEREGDNLVIYLIDELDQHCARNTIEAPPYRNLISNRTNCFRSEQADIYG